MHLDVVEREVGDRGLRVRVRVRGRVRSHLDVVQREVGDRGLAPLGLARRGGRVDGGGLVRVRVRVRVRPQVGVRVRPQVRVRATPGAWPRPRQAAAPPEVPG